MSHRTDRNQPCYTRSQCIGLAHCMSILALTLGVVMLLSNILASKIWSLFGIITLDGGFILFPLTYVIGDIIVEQFHRKIADRIATWCCILNVLAFVCFCIVDWLPDAPGVTNIALSKAFGLSGRIMLASTLAFLVSQRVNNKVYEDVREYTDADHQMWLRAFYSSVCARVLDTAIFTIVAFAGRESIGALLWQMVSSYAMGMLVESCMIPLTVKVNRSLFSHFRSQS